MTYRFEEPEHQTARAICEQCGGDVKSWRNLILDDDGDWRCSSCRTKNIREKHSYPGQKCDVLGCSKTVKDHMDEFRRIVTSPNWDARFSSKREGSKEEVPF